MNWWKRIYLRYVFWLLLLFAMTTVLKSIFDVAKTSSQKNSPDGADILNHLQRAKELQKSISYTSFSTVHKENSINLSFSDTLVVNKEQAIHISKHLTDSIPAENEQVFFPNSSDLEKLRRHYVPLVYRRDPAALHKYIAYITKAEDLLPLQTNAIIIVSNYRSGSSFFGELFNQHPDIFYVFEPLLLLSPTDRCDVNVKFKTRIIHEVAQCIFPDWNEIYFDTDKATRPRKTRNVFNCLRKYFCFYPFTKELAEEEHCPRASLPPNKVFDAWEHCGSININLASNACRRKKMVAMKLIRLCDLYELEELVTKLHMNIKVIHLLRDPRGIADSRRMLHRRLHLRHSLLRTCTKQANNANIGLFIKPQWLAGRYKMFRYEDAAIDPFQTAKELYDFIGIDFADSVKEWIINNTVISQPEEIIDIAAFNVSGPLSKEEYLKMKMPKKRVNPWGHTRNSKSVVQKWQKSLSFLQAQAIDGACSEIMKIGGYLPLNNAVEYANKTIHYFLDKSPN